MNDNHRDQPQPFGGHIARLAGDSTPWWPEPVRPAQGNPNIIVVLLDDLGFSDISPYGSEISTPTLDRLSAGGLRFTNYHTAPLCSPSRASIHTGMNPHRAGFAGVANFDPGFPGWTMEIDPSIDTLPHLLRNAGYATFAVGKWHLTRDGAMHDGAPRNSWPLQVGYDRFYGVLEGWTNMHHPHRLVRDNSPVAVDTYPDGYYFTDDITDEAISYLKSLRSHDSTRPYFLYLAHGAVHGPLQAKANDIATHRGRYQQGWDEVRARRFANQIELGLFDKGTALPPRNHEPGYEVEAWATLSAEAQDRYARYMEVYAAMVDNVDQNLARLLAAVEALGDLDNTVVLFTSDNGATREGGAQGTRSYYRQFGNPAGFGRDFDIERDPDLIGGPQAMVHYPRGWGMASNTPFRLYKSCTHAGGVRVPMIVSWPKGIGLDRAGTIHRQYQYVTDLLPTILELAQVETPKDLDGASFASAITHGATESTHLEQYSECFGNRSFYRNGWKLVTLHQRGAAYDDTEWELYNITTDPTEVNDVAAQHPEVIAELADAWERTAWNNQVFPLDDGLGLLQVLRRPDEASLNEPVRLLAGTPSLERYRSQKLVALRDFDIEIDIVHQDADGVLVAHGDQGGGYVVYIEHGIVHFGYNEYGIEKIVAANLLDPGRHQIHIAARCGEPYTWNFTISVDGRPQATLDGVEMLMGFAPFQGIDVGIDRRSPVLWSTFETHGAFAYPGVIEAVTYLPGPPAPYDPAELIQLMRSAGRRTE